MIRIGIDLGGTNIAAGVVDEGQHIVAEVSLPTGAERPAEAVVADICRAAEKAMEKICAKPSGTFWKLMPMTMMPPMK